MAARQVSWPILEGVAEWISSRVTATKRGYEIHNITGIDEGISNKNNNSEMNMLAQIVLGEAIGLAQRLGYTPPPYWNDIRPAHVPSP